MKAYALTNVGKVRKINQDAVLASTEPVGILPNLFLVADGMGGHKAGDFASRYLINRFVEVVSKSIEETPKDVIKEAIDKVNDELFIESRRNPDLAGMGTTLVAAYIIDNKLYTANIGDSRLYIIRKSGIEQITNDHSYVEEMVRRGLIKRDSQEYNERKNIITRAVGVELYVKADYFCTELEPGDYILMCSDGLSNMVEDSELFRLVLSPGTMSRKCHALLDEANTNGGKDNIAILLVEPMGKEVSL